ncbi:helicase-related protein [Deinococcus budaensis]|uniref:SNF2 family DNA or RNA helicase n=1 Tax=Deinococcus budaensis TaxID=1665626 RepID=A0A7W8LNX1_9DEIO|nr:helicase-related protein [Deinococcus budaensis]MBB5233178.1 SNF2 family DNA or RNA helicase [Deinococcus budaensis]
MPLLLDDLRSGTSVRGLIADQVVQVLSVNPVTPEILSVVLKDSRGQLTERLIYPGDLETCELVARPNAYTFDGDAAQLRLVSEALRIQLAHLFDPYLAIHTSQVQPLPHQITAVYGEMLNRQPLRFLLADDPGAGKTIMAGLLIKELMVRGEVERCLIVAPGGLVEQWQDELAQKFGLAFDLLSRDRITASRTADPFGESPFWIARMDMLSRNPELQARLAAHEWDLIVVDEAHRMSAHVAGSDPKYTKRFLLGRELAQQTRHFLLMTATPHNGKDEDFGLFMSLLDADRFEGRSAGKVNASDLMRRMVKEDLKRFDGRPLFPERVSQTVAYALSPEEQALYDDVTDYVREEMNRADRLDENRRVNVGFALQTLQRRLASSPEAIYQSLRRRRERLEARVREETTVHLPTADDWEEFDDLGEAEAEALEQEVLDRATSAQTVQELQAEIGMLTQLEQQALRLRNSRRDAKWAQLSDVLQSPQMFHPDGERRKLIVFSEARDTLHYLASRIRTLLGQEEAVELIHGGVSREARRAIVERFNHGRDLKVLIANDAAGEGLNLQTANLMVNYDLPWNPNRLEQRFGRIHRIGQEEVCFLWNLVAAGTREGDVYATLLNKLEAQASALGGRVFDVLGQLFEGQPLRDLLMEAIRYGDSPAVRARLHQAIAGAVDTDALRALLEERALGQASMDTSEVMRIRDDMERAEARKLQPHFIESFFLTAFGSLGGNAMPRENGRYEIRQVPARVRDRAQELHPGLPVNREYRRVTFDKHLIRSPGSQGHSPEAAFLCPGHPLLDAVIDLTLSQAQAVLRQGSVLIDPQNRTPHPRLLAYVMHEVRDNRATRGQTYTVVSRRLQFVELHPDGSAHDAGFAPHLDYRAPTPAEDALARPHTQANWLSGDIPALVRAYAAGHLAPQHVEEVRGMRLPHIDRVEHEVHARLMREINHWDARARELKGQEAQGKQPRVNSQKARERAAALAERLERRLDDLNRERAISAGVPEVLGVALVVPEALTLSAAAQETSVDAAARARVEQAAMQAVWQTELALGRQPRDVSAERGLGYDLESRDPDSGRLHFIEVKGRWEDADTVTLTRNEMLASRNAPEQFRLALVRVTAQGTHPPRYVSHLPFREPGFAEVAATFRLSDLEALAQPPH